MKRNPICTSGAWNLTPQHHSSQNLSMFTGCLRGFVYGVSRIYKPLYKVRFGAVGSGFRAEGLDLGYKA